MIDIALSTGFTLVPDGPGQVVNAVMRIETSSPGSSTPSLAT
jgi:hypothetical protein